MICASVNRVFFIGISSLILPRKLYFRIPLRSGRITQAGLDRGIAETRLATTLSTRRQFPHHQRTASLQRLFASRPVRGFVLRLCPTAHTSRAITLDSHSESLTQIVQQRPLEGKPWLIDAVEGAEASSVPRTPKKALMFALPQVLTMLEIGAKSHPASVLQVEV
jgi:hypothetical protein